MFNLKYRYLFAFALGIYSYLSSLFLETFRFYSIDYTQILLAAVFVLDCMLIWEGNRLIEPAFKPQIIKQGNKFRTLLLQLLLSQVIAVASGVLVYYLIAGVFLERRFETREIELKLVILFSLRVNLFLQCINAIFFFFDKFRQKELEAESLKRINMQAKLQAITSQVNPHFLFNNLNVLSTLVMQKSIDANKFIEAFSAVYRYILQNRETEIVTLGTELEFIEPYIYLLKTRFGNALHIEVDIGEKYKEMYIVPVALQILMENATKHNVVSVKLPLNLRLYIRDENHLVMENNYQEKKEKPLSNNVGLENINQRYKILSGKEIVVNKNDKIFSVAIPLLQPGEIRVLSAN